MGKRAAEATARRFFDRTLTDRERAVFEGGIALGAIYHQFVGLPITRQRDVMRLVERVIERTTRIRPYKVEAKARIVAENVREAGGSPYGYDTLQGRHLDVRVKVKYGRATATLRLRYVKELDYPLMYVERIRG